MCPAWARALEALLRSSSTSSTPICSLEAYTRMLKGLGAAGVGGRQGRKLLSHMHHARVEPDVKFHNTLLHAIGKDQAYTHSAQMALQIIDHMRREEDAQKPDIISYTAALTATKKEWEIALSLIKRLKEDEEEHGANLVLDMHAHGAIMSAFARGGEHDKAMHWFESIPSQDEATQSAPLLGQAMASACSWERALSLLEAMRQPTVPVVNAFLTRLGSELNTNNEVNNNQQMMVLPHLIALRCVHWMRHKHGLEPNIRTYNALMHTMRYEWVRALEVFESLCAHSRARNGAGAGAAGSSSSSSGKAKAKTKGLLQPSLVSYNILLDALAKAEQWEKAIDLLRSEWTRGVRPDKQSYTACIQAMGTRWELALELLYECPSEERDVHVLNAALKSLGGAQKWEQALQLVETMRKEISIDDVTRTLMLACCPWEVGVPLFLPRLPSEIPWITAIGALDQAGEVDKAQKLFHGLVDAGILIVQTSSVIDLHEFTVPLAKAQIRESAYHHRELLLIVGQGTHRGGDELREAIYLWLHDECGIHVTSEPGNAGRLRALIEDTRKLAI